MTSSIESYSTSFSERRLLKRGRVLEEVRDLRIRAYHCSPAERSMVEKKLLTRTRTAELLGADEDEIESAITQADRILNNEVYY